MFAAKIRKTPSLPFNNPWNIALNHKCTCKLSWWIREVACDAGGKVSNKTKELRELILYVNECRCPTEFSPTVFWLHVLFPSTIILIKVIDHHYLTSDLFIIVSQCWAMSLSADWFSRKMQFSLKFITRSLCYFPVLNTF